jgi:DNA-binding CsgD family transcriptional regulator
MVVAVGVRLSPRERQVLVLYADGYSYAGIGRVLGIGHSAVRLYLRRARGKLGVASSDAAIVVAWRAGLLAGWPVAV